MACCIYTAISKKMKNGGNAAVDKYELKSVHVVCVGCGGGCGVGLQNGRFHGGGFCGVERPLAIRHGGGLCGVGLS